VAVLHPFIILNQPGPAVISPEKEEEENEGRGKGREGK